MSNPLNAQRFALVTTGSSGYNYLLACLLGFSCGKVGLGGLSCKSDTRKGRSGLLRSETSPQEREKIYQGQARRGRSKTPKGEKEKIGRPKDQKKSSSAGFATKRAQMNISEQVNNLLDHEDWSGAREVILNALRAEPDHHWLLSRLSTTYYEERRYLPALKFIQKARAEVPSCPLVLWDYAGTLDMLGKKQRAIEVYKGLLNRGAEAIASEECGEGINWARSLLADCKYRLAFCYQDIGDLKGFVRYYVDYLEDVVDKGIESIYEPNELYTMHALTSGTVEPAYTWNAPVSGQIAPVQPGYLPGLVPIGSLSNFSIQSGSITSYPASGQWQNLAGVSGQFQLPQFAKPTDLTIKFASSLPSPPSPPVGALTLPGGPADTQRTVASLQPASHP